MLKPEVCVDIRGASDEDVIAVIEKCVSLGAIRGIYCDKVFVKWGDENSVWLSGNDGGYPVISVSEALGRTDNGWHERGELPPEGIVCIYDGREVIIKAHLFSSDEKYAAFQRIDGNGCGYARALSFRPIKTEREKFVERFCSDNKIYDRPMDLFAGDLYDKGLRYTE